MADNHVAGMFYPFSIENLLNGFYNMNQKVID